jgi:hypothetical protein
LGRWTCGWKKQFAGLGLSAFQASHQADETRNVDA